MSSLELLNEWLRKEGDGEGVATSGDAGFFTPTFGGSKRKRKRKNRDWLKTSEEQELDVRSIIDQGFEKQAPGPPPRPGLVWKPQTHRWVRPGERHHKTKTPKGRPGEQWWKPEQEGEDRPLVTADGQRIPPAWKHLWINHDPEGSRLATGFDKKGRGQTLYSVKYGKVQSAKKFGRVKSFHQVHGALVEQINKDVLDNREEAIVASLINLSYIRPGSAKDTGAKKKAYGATTLLSDHITINGDEIVLDFPSKKGGHTVRRFEDKALAGILSQRLRQKQSGVPMFDTSEIKVNEYIYATTVDLDLLGTEDDLKFTSKDFRTLGGTRIAIAEMTSGRHEMASPPTIEKMQKKIIAANKKNAAPLNNAGIETLVKKEFELALNNAKKPIGEIVSAQLQNAPAEAVRSYIDPHVFADWDAAYENAQREVVSQLIGVQDAT